MKRRGHVVILLALFTILSQAQEIPLHNIYFRSDGAEINSMLRALIDTIYAQTPDERSVRIGICGSDDTTKIQFYRNLLADQRARAVYDYLISSEVKGENIRIDRKFENQLHYFSADKTEASFAWYFEVVVKKVSVHKALFSSLKNEFPKQGKCFLIDPDKDEELKGKEGTTVKIKRKSLIYADGQEPGDKARVCICEYYSIADILKAGLVTLSNGRMLETGGMIKITADWEGKELTLKEGSSVELRMPKKYSKKRGPDASYDYTKEMKLFWANENNETAYMNWDENPPSYNEERFYQRSNKDISENPEREYIEVPEKIRRDTIMVSDGVFVVALSNEDEASPIDEYIFKSSSLGWINCDRFYEIEKKTDLIVKIDTAMRASVRIVFKNIRSIVPGDADENGTYRFEEIPEGEKVVLIAYCIRDKKPYYASKEITLTKNAYESLDLSATTLAMIEAEFKRLEPR